jgi:hypothetical protein
MCERDKELWLSAIAHWRIVMACAPWRGYWHLLLIIKYKHPRYQGDLLMASYTDMYTRSKKGIKMRMETIIGLYAKGNYIISWLLFYVGSCFVLNNNYCCMCCHCRSMLHQICRSWINNDNIHQGSKNCLWWWQYPFISMYGGGKGGKLVSIHELHSPMR